MEHARRFPGGARAADLLLWLVVTSPLLLPDDPDSPAGLPLGWVKIAAVPLLGLAVLVCRRQPLAAAVVPVTLGLAASPEMHTNTFAIAQGALAYLLGRRVPERWPVLWFFAGVSVVGGLLLLVSPAAGVVDGGTLIANVLLVLVLPWLAGQYMRQRAELVGAGWQLAERLEQQQQLVSDRARLRERSRIAQDMHDSLGHDLSLIAIRAAALQVTADVGPQGRQAAGELRQVAAAATQRLREVIGVLREDGEGAPAQPAGESVASLVLRAADSGVPVTLYDRLRPRDEGPALPPMTDRAIYWVVQEALTNATKHAAGVPIIVTLCQDGPQVVVTIANDTSPAEAPPSPPEDPGAPGGFGLIGLDERVRQAGGTLQAQSADGRFTITACLPVTAGAPVTPPGASSTTREHARAHRTAHRRMLHTIWLPAIAVAVLLALMVFNDSDEARSSVLDRDIYQQLRPGERQTSVEDRLPARQLRTEHPPPNPPGVDECRLYRTTADASSPAYRLCFTDGRLSHKDTVKLDV